MANRLAEATSPYLRQHADNPVPWWPWCTEAFEEARRRDVPVFVSIGYAACHWCHVMARESFEDPAIAEMLSAGFVSIKVDREEHPDVDDAYMAITQAVTGQGGWPMTVFTTPQGRAFHAGTYFPPQRRGSIPAFSEVLGAVGEAWTQRRDQVDASALSIAEAAGRQRQQQARLATAMPSPDGPDGHARPPGVAERYGPVLTAAVAALADQEDVEHGGYGAAPKFPPSPVLGFLLGEAARGDRSARDQARRTISAMTRSALFDQVEGGFARYATDRVWALPHFEKMLYDNAQLIAHCARLAALPGIDDDVAVDARRATLTSIDWLRQHMLLEEGLLASSLDADTVDAAGHHTEGGTYLVTDEELHAAALAAGCSEDEAGRFVALNAGVPTEPAHVGPRTPRTLHFARPLDRDQRDLFERVLPQLRRLREDRAQPARDEKVVAGWNAMAVQALAEASSALGEPSALEFAESLALALWQTHVLQDLDGDRTEVLSVARLSYAGVAAPQPGTLADYAHLASACFALASAGADSFWAQRGAAVLRRVHQDFVVDPGHAPGSRSRADSTGAEATGEAGAEAAGEAGARAGGPTVLEALDVEGLLREAQNGPSLATPLDGPEPSGLAAFAAALQTAEALQLSADIAPGGVAPVNPKDLLNHLDLLGPEAPGAVGASLRVARSVVSGSPAFRVVSASPEAMGQLRRMAAVCSVPVEPLEDGAEINAETDAETDASGGPGPTALRVSVCLSGADARLCRPPVDSVDAALAEIVSGPPASRARRT